MNFLIERKHQYITFTKVFYEQVKLHGKTQKAVQETIRICKDMDVLREYLLSKESEVVDLMMQLYDKEEIMRVHDFGLVVRSAVEAYRDCNMDFKSVVNRISSRYAMSPEIAEEMVGEYGEEL